MKTTALLAALISLPAFAAFSDDPYSSEPPANIPPGCPKPIPLTRGDHISKPPVRFLNRAEREMLAAGYDNAYWLDNGLIAAWRDGRYAILDINGHELVAPRYDGFQIINGMLFARQGGLWAYLDVSGREILPPQFQRVTPFTLDSRIVHVCKTEKDCFFMGLDGKPTTALPPNGFLRQSGYSQVNIADGLNRFKRNGLYGYINQQGEEVIAPQYENTDGFSEGLAAVRKDSKEGYINTSGRIVIPLQYDHAGGFYNGRAIVKVGNMKGLIDRKGTFIVTPQYDEISSDFGTEQAVEITKNGKHGILDWQSGKEIVPPEYAWGAISPFSEGIVRVGRYEPYGYSFYNRQGEKISKKDYYEADDFKHGMARIGISMDTYGFINRRGEEIIPPDYGFLGFLSEGLIVAQKGEYGFINSKGETVIPFQYQWALDFHDGRAAVKNNDKWGFIDHQGNEVVPLQYDEINSFQNGLAQVRQGNESGIIDRDGKFVIPLTEGFFNEPDLNHDRIAFNNYHLWGFYDLRGHQIVPPRYLKHRFGSLDKFPLVFENGLIEMVLPREGTKAENANVVLVDVEGCPVTYEVK